MFISKLKGTSLLFFTRKRKTISTESQTVHYLMLDVNIFILICTKETSNHFYRFETREFANLKKIETKEM